MSLSVKSVGRECLTCPLLPGRTIRRWVFMPADSTRLNSAASSIGSLRTNPSSHTDLPSIAAEGGFHGPVETS